MRQSKMEVGGQSETKGDKKQGWDASSHLGPRVDVLATGHSGGKPGSAGVSDLRTRVRCVVAEAVRPSLRVCDSWELRSSRGAGRG